MNSAGQLSMAKTPKSTRPACANGMWFSYIFDISTMFSELITQFASPPDSTGRLRRFAARDGGGPRNPRSFLFPWVQAKCCVDGDADDGDADDDDDGGD